MDLKELRNDRGLTQQEASVLLGISLRSYKDYENNPMKKNNIKYEYLYQKLSEHTAVDEEHGVLSIEKIKSIVNNVFSNYQINFCYLFGSYAKNKANSKSDVDLIIDSEVTGLEFFGLIEDLRESLHKKVDLLKINQLDNNQPLLREIMKDGIKIYG